MKTFFWFFILSVNLPCLVVGQDRPLRILSYNILNGMKLDESVDKAAFTSWLTTVDCDILALQEAQQFTPKSLEEMARRISHPFAVLLKEGGYPTALTSKYPIVKVRKVIENMHHGFIQAESNGYNIMVIHLSPHKYWKRRDEVDLILATIRSGPKGKWILMGDFNAESPLDADMYKDGKLAFDRKRAQEKYPIHDNLVNGGLDFEAIGKILEAGFVDVVRLKSSGRLWSQPTRRFAEVDGRAVPRRVDYVFTDKDAGTVVVTSDNGMPFPRAKASLYDPGVRMPLAVRWPGAGLTARPIPCARCARTTFFISEISSRTGGPPVVLSSSRRTRRCTAMSMGARRRSSWKRPRTRRVLPASLHSALASVRWRSYTTCALIPSRCTIWPATRRTESSGRSCGCDCVFIWWKRAIRGPPAGTRGRLMRIVRPWVLAPRSTGP